MNPSLPLLYGALSEWWPLMSAPADYADAAAFYARLMRQFSSRPPERVLELGCGGGNNALHLKGEFDLTLIDLSPGMLEVSKKLNPECAHRLGDMRSVRIGREFDCVFIQDAASYLITPTDIVETAETIRAHLSPNGVCVIAPDFVRETFAPSTDCGGHDGDGRGLRYLSWTWDPDPEDHTFITDYAYLLRHRDGSTEVDQDRHIEGLFAESEWIDSLAAAGLEGEFVTYDHEHGPIGSRVLVGHASVR